MCLFGVRAARRRDSERRAFVAHKLLLLQPQQVAVVRLGSLCSSSHTAKNFAFIFDIQAQVRLFLPCGSPCVRSTSDCAVLLRSRRTKDGGIIREMSLSMRVLSVSPPLRGHRGFPFKGERRYGRDALSNTSCECVVAKANEADCSANAEVQTREERGKCN